jgi:GTP cyclohydrolase I
MSRGLQMTVELTKSELPDVQSSRDERRIAINKVGVTAVSYPIEFASTPDAPPHATVGEFDMTVSLPADRKGTHMSRFLQLLRDWNAPLSIDSLQEFCQAIRNRLQSSTANVTVRFPYFIDRSAPVTGETGKIKVDVVIDVVSGEKNDLMMTVVGPATSLCPCSKQISDRGATISGAN